MSNVMTPGGVPGPEAAVRRVYESLAGHVRKRLHASRTENVPAYVALPESDGNEMFVMKDANLVRLTEAGVISEVDNSVLVAATKNMLHFTALKRLAGLRVMADDLGTLLAKALDIPGGDASDICRGLVINLDRVTAGGTSPESGTVFEQLSRLCALRKDRPVEWTLCCWLVPALTSFDSLPADVQAFVEESSTFQSVVAAMNSWFGNAPLKGQSLAKGLNVACLVPLFLAISVAQEGWTLRVVEVRVLGHDVGEPVVALALELQCTGTDTSVAQAMAGVTESLLTSRNVSIGADGVESNLAIN